MGLYGIPRVNPPADAKPEEKKYAPHLGVVAISYVILATVTAVVTYVGYETLNVYF